MPPKERARSKGKAGSKTGPPKHTAEQLDKPARRQAHPAALLRRAGLDPHSLTSRDVLQLQLVVGNHAVSRLFSQMTRPRPTHGKGERAGLPADLKAGVEALSGLPMDDVRVHYDSPEPAGLRALAYTRGTEIHVGPGQEKHLPHEAWHVAQQKQGRVKATLRARGVAINADQGLEVEADLMGARAAAGRPGVVQNEGGVFNGPEYAPQSRVGSPGGLRSLSVRTQAAGGVSLKGSDSAVVQARWVDATGPLLKWEPAEQGYTWWFNQEDRTMAYTPASVTELSREQAQLLTWRPHKEWQMEALSRIDPDDAPAPAFTYQSLVAKGRERWEELTKAGPGALDPATQGARDWFFKEYYTTAARTEDGETDISSNYNARPPSYEQKRQRGEYSGRLKTAEGRMALANTYALGGGGEVYYNPRTGRAERMSASEILFQQWRVAAAAQGRQGAALSVKEETVAGDALPMLRAIRTGAAVQARTDKTFVPGEDGFHAMLAIPNVTAAIFLIRDHGRELGIRTITRIELLKNSHILVHFG